MVDEGFLTLDQLSVALAEQDRTGSPLGKLLVDLGFVSEGAVANALAEQHGGLLKTEFGVSAGLKPVPAETPFVATTTAAEPPDRATRILQLETALNTVVRERDAFAERINDLQAKLKAAPQPNGADTARVNAAAAARIAELEAEVQARSSESKKHEAEVARVTAAAVAHINGLEAKLLAAQSNGTEQPGRIAELEAELTRVTQAASARINELAAELQVLASKPAEPDGDALARATAAESRIAELEAEVARAATAAAGRIAELEAALQARPSAPVPDEAELARAAAAEVRIAELEAALQARGEVAQPTEAATARIAELEAELEKAHTARNELANAVAAGGARISELERDVGELRRQRMQHGDVAPAPQAPAPVGDAHLRLMPSATGYNVVEWAGPAPESGTVLDVDGVRFVVLRVAASPFPGSTLRCAYLDRI